EVDDDLAVDVEPLGVVVALLRDERDRAHERERAHEVREAELAAELSVRDRPAGQGGKRGRQLSGGQRGALGHGPITPSLRSAASSSSPSPSDSRRAASVCSPRPGSGATGPSGAPESFTGLPETSIGLPPSARGTSISMSRAATCGSANRSGAALL